MLRNLLRGIGLACLVFLAGLVLEVQCPRPDCQRHGQVVGQGGSG